MEENGIYGKKKFYAQSVSNSKSAKGRMLLSSIVILLFAAALFLGIIGVLCSLVIKSGLICVGVY